MALSHAPFDRSTGSEAEGGRSARFGDLLVVGRELDDDDLVAGVRAILRGRGVGRSQVDHVAAAVAIALDRTSLVDRASGGPRRVLDETEAESIAVAANRAVWDEEMLTSAAVAHVLGRTPGNAREAASDLRRRGVVVGLRDGRRYLYPAFQFDGPRRRVHPEVEQVNVLLDAAHDPWGVASWWVSPNAFLGNERPMDLLGTDRQAGIPAAARAELDLW